MVAQLVQLSDSPNGRRYAESDREGAYLLWRTGGRSLRKTAEALGVSPSTVGSWQQSGKWVERADREDAEDADQARSSIRTMALPRVVKAIAFVEKVVDDETAPVRDRLNAAFWLAGIGGISPVKQSETTILTQPPPPQPTEPEALDTHSLTVDELLERERQRRHQRTRQE